MVSSRACLLTETSDAGSGPHVARCVFSMMFHDKILLYIINGLDHVNFSFIYCSYLKKLSVTFSYAKFFFIVLKNNLVVLILSP